MRIVCPSCDAAYEVPDTILARPRTMRCARCAHDFRPPAAAGSDLEAAEQDEHELADPSWDGEVADAAADAVADAKAPGPPPVSRAERLRVLAGWAGSLLALAMLAWLGVAYRQPVEHAWPASARLYSALGYGYRTAAAPPK